MAFTDNCDLYLAVAETGVNRVLELVRLQRPELFNYASAGVAANPELWCSKVPHTSDVTKHNNPLFTIMDPIPLLGVDSPQVSVGFCAQVTDAKVDFHPSNTIALPAEMHPPLQEQRFSLYLRLCAAIVCPSPKLVEQIAPGDVFAGARTNDAKGQQSPIVLTGATNCCCLDVYAIGHVGRRIIAGQPTLIATVDDLDIAELAPPGLKQNLICYLKTSLNVLLREKMTIALQTLMFNIPLFGSSSLDLFPTPNPPVPFNPAVEDDSVKVFVTMNVV